MRNNCYQGGNKHKFVARYTEKPSLQDGDSFKAERIRISGNIRDLFILRVYLFDICEWCGNIVKPKTP